jgi:DNA invertase Pin-like site-specific DNA recombinase
MINKFTSKNENIIAKYMPKFAQIENERAAKMWNIDIAKQKVQNGGREAKEVTVQQRAQAILRFKAGQSLNKIMERLEISKYALARVLAQEGLKECPEKEMPRKARLISQMLQDGMSQTAIARELGISRQAVKDWIVRYGLGRR